MEIGLKDATRMEIQKTGKQGEPERSQFRITLGSFINPLEHFETRKVFRKLELALGFNLSYGEKWNVRSNVYCKHHNSCNASKYT